MVVKKTVSIIEKYIALQKLSKGATVEETINIVLDALQKDPYNRPGELKEELIASCAVVLNGMLKIKRPVELYRSLALVFEPRGWCLFDAAKTIERAFLRLQGEAIKRGESEALWRVVSKLKNPHVTRIVSYRVPTDDLIELLHSNNLELRENAAAALALKRGKSTQLLEFLLNNGDLIVSKGAARALPRRNDLPVDFLERLLAHQMGFVRYYASNSLAHRFMSRHSMMRKLVSSSDAMVRSGATTQKKVVGAELRHITGIAPFRRNLIEKITRPLIRRK